MQYPTLLAIKTCDSRHFQCLRNLLPSELLAMNQFITVRLGLKNLAKAHSIQLVARHTSMPVPKVHSAFVHKGAT
jgi:hypothetical protein